jgi:protein TonB
MTLPHGYFAWYDTNGTIDSAGYTYKGKKDKTWYYYSDSLTVWQSETYNRGILIKRMDEAALKAEREDQRNTLDTSSFQTVEKEAAFKGDGRAWIRYLEKNLQFPGRAMQLDKQGKVVVSFVVDKDGSTRDIFLSQSVEYSLDEEALRLVRQSPKWEPAIQNGRPVNAYRRQPITFAFR